MPRDSATRTAATVIAALTALAVLDPAHGQEDAPAVAQPRAADAEPSAENGARLYYEHGCYGCHGFHGQTGARDLVGTNSPLIADEETFITYLRLRADQAPLFPSTRMPNYPESALSDAQARDLYAYIRTFELDAPDVEDVPALQRIIESAERPYRP